MPKDALDMLSRCHRRLEEQTASLCDAAEALAGGSGGAEERQTVEDALAFLRRTMRRHIDDEERSVFPRLEDRAELEELLAQLTAEHRDHESLFSKLEAAWNAADHRAMLGHARKLSLAYVSHARLEDEQLLPAVETHLDLEALAAEMEGRRGKAGGGANRRR
jgi:hemerythrin-like domain-containing protein